VIADQAREIGALQAQVADLQRRLGKDSSNSSKPPSSDGLAKPPTPPRQRHPGQRRPGKQPGAPGAHLAPVDHPDQVVVHRPAWCGGCGADLTLAPVVGVQARQVFDVPTIGLQVVEHRAEQRACRCGQVTAAGFPEQVAAPAGYGPAMRALGAYLLVRQHLPVARAAELLADVVGAPCSTGWLAGLTTQAAEGLEGFAAQARRVLATSQVVHVDETGARVAGRLAWVHVACTSTWTHLSAHAKRGVEATDAAGVLPDLRGVAVHDCWSPYWHYTQASHAVCAAHLLRELGAAANEPGQAWADELAEWLSIAIGVAAKARHAGAERVDPAVAGVLLDVYGEIIAKGHAANPPPPARPARRRPRRSSAARLLERLEGHRDEVLRFLVDLRVPFTNNQAERDLRMVKLQQKISARREAPHNRAEVKGLRHRACRSRPVKLGAARPGRRWEGWEQPRQRRDGSVLPDGPGPASKTRRCTRGTSGKAS
jgi:transposase